jgi:hypothetical protein
LSDITPSSGGYSPVGVNSLRNWEFRRRQGERMTRARASVQWSGVPIRSLVAPHLVTLLAEAYRNGDGFRGWPLPDLGFPLQNEPLFHRTSTVTGIIMIAPSVRIGARAAEGLIQWGSENAARALDGPMVGNRVVKNGCAHAALVREREAPQLRYQTLPPINFEALRTLEH